MLYSVNFLFHYITQPVYTLCLSFCRHLSHDFSNTVNVNQLTRQKLSKLLSFRLMSFSGINNIMGTLHKKIKHKISINIGLLNTLDSKVLFFGQHRLLLESSSLLNWFFDIICIGYQFL